ncbi:hypothetical protein OG361_38380 [Streptomyces sp. NBC_00090]|uniref:DUF6059 family protein n=1 Tax=Streptomyces sp. NBC_00090 TaxID=2903619 RepID=UPI00324BC3C3
MPPYMSRCLKALGNWLIAAGQLWIPPPPPPPLEDPPPGHPERLADGIPLTDLERSLREELPSWP